VKVPDNESRANSTGPESCADVVNGVCESLTGEGAGRVWTPEINQSWVPTRSEHAEGDSKDAVMARMNLAGSETSRMCRNTVCETREALHLV
jgi:hypothetical protein